MNITDRHRPMQTTPTGIPGWLQQFLNSQGGMQGLLYSAGGMQGLLNMIQQQSQPRPPQAPNNPDPLGWQDWLTENHPLPEWQPDASKGQFSNVSGFSHSLTPEDIATIQGIPAGTRGLDLLKALPKQFQGSMADPGSLTNYNAETAGPFWQKIRAGENPIVSPSDYQTAFGNFNRWQGIGGGDALKAIPLGKYDYAAKYGYAMPNAPEYQGQQYSSTGQIREDQRVNPMARPNTPQILQTLRNAGWNPDTQGWGPQEWEGKTPKQQTMLNDLVYAISPKNAPLGTSHERYLAKQQKEAPLPKSPDPFVGMQGAIERDAYVNDTLGGGFFGGVIPEQDAAYEFGRRYPGGAQDPHFPTPQLRLNPLPGESRYDTYAGWASDQGAAFGQAPWASDSAWGHAQGYDRPNLYQQPPPPTTAWQPTPQFNNWGGTQGWGNTSNNNAWGGSNTQQQQQPMSFGNSPWGNPWGMK